MKDVLVRASDLIGRPVVTLRGDQVGEVQDVVLGLSQAVLVGFTLRNPGFFGGPRKESVPWDSVHAVGPDAVMIQHEDKVAERQAVPAGDAHAATDIPVITETGDEVGRVVDVVLVTGTPTQIVGFEVEAGAAMPSKGQHVLIPVDAMTARLGPSGGRARRSSAVRPGRPGRLRRLRRAVPRCAQQGAIMKVRALTGRKVLDISAANELGTVQSVIIDPETSRLVALRVTGDAPVLPLAEVKAIGADAVTVDGPDVLHQPQTDLETRVIEHSLDPIGLRVLVEDGTEMGSVDDLEIDPEDGVIHSLTVGGQEVPGERIIGVGSYALVISD